MKRVLSVLLSLTMLLMLLPAVAAGDGTGPYTVYLDGKCKAGEASVYVFLASETEKTYNAFWLTLAYDDSVLEFVGADNVAPQDVTRELKASARNGEVTVAGCGDDLEVSNGPVKLRFAVKTDCLTQVQLTEAQISARSQAKADAKPAKLDAGKSVYMVASGYYTVELPEGVGVYGDAAVAAGGDYTFRTDPHYDYTFDVTVDKDPVQVQNNSDGSYTVKTVNGLLRIACVVRAQGLPRHGGGQRQGRCDRGEAGGLWAELPLLCEQDGPDGIRCVRRGGRCTGGAEPGGGQLYHRR